MKIAILGNMNNNGFALMRYFRDLGADAHLLLYSNDGVGTLNHFRPEFDTHEPQKWQSFIHQTHFSNSHFSVIPRWLQKPFSVIYNARNYFLRREWRMSAHYPKEVERALSPYSQIITSGYGPAILYNAGRDCTIFAPYSSGVEGVCRRYAPRSLGARLVWEYARGRQVKGLKRTKHIINAEMGITKDQFEKLRMIFHPLAMPMVYVERQYPESTEDELINRVGAMIDQTEFSLLMHSRLAWTPEICDRNQVRSKNNHWVIKAFKQVITANPSLIAKMVILEYGPDIQNTKRLVSAMGLDSLVIWVPKTSRKNLMWLLRKVNVGVGEFIESPRTLWGGTGWEVLASGKPLLQGFWFAEGEFDSFYGYPQPPMLPVLTEEDVLKHLSFVADHPKKAAEIGEHAREWFNTYNGIALAKKWLDLVTDLAGSHQTTISTVT